MSEVNPSSLIRTARERRCVADLRDFGNTASANTFLYEEPNINAGTINDNAREVMAAIRRQHEQAEWIDLGHTPTYVSATSVTIPSDLTATYSVNRTVRLSGTVMATTYALVTGAVFSGGLTTLTLSVYEGAIDSSVTRIAYHLVKPANMYLTGLAGNMSDARFRITGSTDATKLVAFEVDGLTTGTTRTLSVQDKDGIIPLIETAKITIPATSAGPSSVVLAEDTDNGTNTVTIIAPSTLASDRVITLPDETGTMVTTVTPASTYFPTGTVVQTLQGARTTPLTSTSSSWVDIATVTITPKRDTNKVLVQATVMGRQVSGSGIGYLRLARDSTGIGVGDAAGSRIQCGCILSRTTSDNTASDSHALSWIDSPASASSITYRVQVYVVGGTAYINQSPDDPNSSAGGRGITTITASEIVA